jgi:gliding motility-associated lipoprotein GldH
MNQFRLYCLILPVFLLFLGGCEKKLLQDIPKMEWKKDAPVKFTYTSTGEDVRYQLTLHFRHYTQIVYGDVLVNVQIVSPSGVSYESPYIITLRDRETGRPLGEIMLDLCDLDTVIEPVFRFPEKGDYTITISHDMDVDVLDGILTVGFFINKIEDPS